VSRIIEWFGLEGTSEPTYPNPCHGQGCPHQLRLPRAPSNLALSASRDGAPQLLWAAVPAPVESDPAMLGGIKPHSGETVRYATHWGHYHCSVMSDA